MNCQRYKPAEFKFTKPVGVQKETLGKGVPQVDMSILTVTENFHAPPAYSVSNDVVVEYPIQDAMIKLDTTPKFYNTFKTDDVKPHNFMSNHVEIDHKDHKEGDKIPLKSVKHPGQRMLA